MDNDADQETDKMNPRSATRRIIPLAAAAAVGVAAGIGAYSLSGHGSSSPKTQTVVVPAQQVSSTSSTDSLTQIYQQDAPGVVDINVTLPASAGSGGVNPFGLPSSPNQKVRAGGTGFEIDGKGDILTAAHVVDGATSIKVAFEDGSTAKATLVGTDNSTDSAVIHVDVPAAKLHPLVLGDSATVQPGQAVAAIGNPFFLSETMTAGIVSAVNRTINAPNNFSIVGAIQTDAAINHGNSGGPLIDVATNTVIGINDQLPSETSANAGIGFAVPIDGAKGAARTLIAGGKVQHAYVGVLIQNAPSNGGAKVASVVSGTPAAKAGLEKGDVLTAWNGKRLVNADQLEADVTAAKPGDTVTLTVRRGSATKHIQLTLGVQPAAAH